MARRAMLHKHPKTSVYYFRKRIPNDLVSVIGKREFKKSLDTKDRKEADRRVVAVEHEFNQLLERERKDGLIPATEKKYVKQRLVYHRFYYTDVTLASIQLNLISATALYNGEVRKIHENAHRTPMTKGGSTPHAILNVVEIRRGLAELKIFERMFLQEGFLPTAHKLDTAKKEEIDRVITELKLFDDAEIGLQTTIPTIAIVKPQSAKGRVTLFDAMEEWKRIRNPVLRSILDWEATIRKFTELHGDVAIADITKDHAREFRDALRMIPAHLAGEYKSLPLNKLHTLAQKGKLNGEPRSARTVNKAMDVLASIIEVGIQSFDATDRNVVKGIKLAGKSKKKEAYTPEELKKLFSSPLYTGCRSIRSRHIPGSLIEKDAFYWLPLMALYTGARVEELGQLRVEDFHKADGFWYISINNEDGKSLKNAFSVRDVPLHPKLIELGILDLYEQQKKRGKKRIFSELEQSIEGRYTKSFSQWFNRYRNNIGLTRSKGQKLDFHALRNTFVTCCYNNDVPERAVRALTGHSDRDAHDGYFSGYKIEKLNNYIKAIEFNKFALQK